MSRRGSLTARVLAALDPHRAQTTAEIARKARTTVAIAGATLNRLCNEGLAFRQAPWLLAPLAPSFARRGRRGR